MKMFVFYEKSRACLLSFWVKWAKLFSVCRSVQGWSVFCIQDFEACLTSGTAPMTPPPCGPPAWKTTPRSPFYTSSPCWTAPPCWAARWATRSCTSWAWRTVRAISSTCGSSVVDSGSQNILVSVLRELIPPWQCSWGLLGLFLMKVSWFSFISEYLNLVNTLCLLTCYCDYSNMYSLFFIIKPTVTTSCVFCRAGFGHFQLWSHDVVALVTAWGTAEWCVRTKSYNEGDYHRKGERRFIEIHCLCVRWYWSLVIYSATMSFSSEAKYWTITQMNLLNEYLQWAIDLRLYELFWWTPRLCYGHLYFSVSHVFSTCSCPWCIMCLSFSCRVFWKTLIVQSVLSLSALNP